MKTNASQPLFRSKHYAQVNHTSQATIYLLPNGTIQTVLTVNGYRKEKLTNNIESAIGWLNANHYHSNIVLIPN